MRANFLISLIVGFINLSLFIGIFILCISIFNSGKYVDHINALDNIKPTMCNYTVIAKNYTHCKKDVFNISNYNKTFIYECYPYHKEKCFYSWPFYKQQLSIQMKRITNNMFVITILTGIVFMITYFTVNFRKIKKIKKPYC
jgi:hypothetical protein